MSCTDRPQTRLRAAGDNLVALEAVHRAGSAAEAVRVEPCEERRRIQRFTWSQRVGKVKRVETARDADLLVGRLFDRDPPVAAPRQAAKPDAARLLSSVARIDGKPGIRATLLRRRAAS